MIPIVVNTYENLIGLDITLKSLSGTEANQPVVICDNGSNTAAKLDYYFGTGKVRLNTFGTVHTWPAQIRNQFAKLQLPETRDVESITGLTDLRMRPSRIRDDRHIFDSIHETFKAFPSASHVVLVSDSLLFNHDFLEHLLTHSAHDLVQGCGRSACFLISRELYAHTLSTAQGDSSKVLTFESLYTQAHDFGGGFVFPSKSVCQHLFPPFTDTASPPYVLAKRVRKFK